MILLVVSCCSATNIKDHLVGVQRSAVQFTFPPRIQRVQGSGACIDEICSVVATAYHVQMLAGNANLGVVGAHTKKVLSLANESDTNKSDVPAGNRVLCYNTANDVSFVYTKKPVRHKSGVLYSYNFHVGQKVTVAGYYDHKFETKEARIIGANTPLIIGSAQLKENLVLDTYVNPGSSGSAVLDEQGNLLGIIVLTGALHLSNGDLPASVALPVRTIANALVKLDPALGSLIFNDIPEEEPMPVQTTWVQYQEHDLPVDTSPVIPRLSAIPSDVPNSVVKLRAKSDAASRLMVNFVTTQCLVQGTQKPICDELSIVDGQQTFREIGKNRTLGEPTRSFPIQKHGVWIQSDWTETAGEIADNLWVFQGSVRDYYLFTFKSVAEDDRCYWEEYPQGVPLFGGGHPAWKGSVACSEEILTDKEFNVLFVFTELRPPDECLTQVVQTAIYYDWIKFEGLKSPILLPASERVVAKVLGQKDLWYTSVSWTDYKEFRAEHKMKF
jgi:hypothetical protein